MHPATRRPDAHFLYSAALSLYSRRHRYRYHRSTTTAPLAPAHLNIDKCRRAEINAANNAELRASAQDVVSTIRTFRPKNTSRNYDPKQREFKVREAQRAQCGTWALRGAAYSIC